MAQVAASSVNCPCPPASHLGHSIVVHRSSTFLQPFFMGVSVVPSFQLPFSLFSARKRHDFPRPWAAPSVPRIWQRHRPCWSAAVASCEDVTRRRIELWRRRINRWWGSWDFLDEICIRIRSTDCVRSCFSWKTKFATLLLWKGEIFKLDRIVFDLQQLRIFFRVQVVQVMPRVLIGYVIDSHRDYSFDKSNTLKLNLRTAHWSFQLNQFPIWQPSILSIPSCVSSWGDRFTCFNNLALALDSLDHHVEAEVRGHVGHVVLGMFRCPWDILGLVQMADPQFSTDIPCCSPFEIWNALFIEIQPTETFRCILFVPCVDFFHKTGIPGSYWPLDPMWYSSSQELQLGCCWNVVEMLYFLNCQQMVWNPGVTPSSWFTVTNLSWKRLGV